MKHLIFDFDGTIVESGPLIYSNFAEYTKNCELSWNELRDLPSNEVISALGVSKLDLPKLILRIRADFKSKLKEQPIVEGIKEAITNLKEHGFELHIVSSNSEDNIDAFLANHGLREAFTSIKSFFTIFGKAHGIEKLLKEISASPKEAIYIGDETRDIQAAEKVGMQNLAVTWGYNSEKALLSYKPKYLARAPMEMVEILCEVSGLLR